jgi:hypothetical protein
MSLFGVLEALAEVGLTEEKIAAAVASNPEIRSATIAKAQEVLAAWQAQSPVDESGRGEHDYYGEPIDTGTYRKDLHIEYGTTAEGALEARVGARGNLIRAVEYGNKHIKEYALARA